jgi:hypothetical protein
VRNTAERDAHSITQCSIAHTIACSGLSRVRTELVYLLVIPSPASHPVEGDGPRVAQEVRPPDDAARTQDRQGSDGAEPRAFSDTTTMNAEHAQGVFRLPKECTAMHETLTMDITELP